MVSAAKKILVLVFFGSMLSLSMVASAGDHAKKMVKKSDIVDIAASNESFSTLVAAVKAAGLVDTLKSEGPFTVFAPTDDAFAKLPEGTLEMLLKPENKDKLVSILTYHVVPGAVMSKDINGKSKVKTVQGDKVKIKAKEKGISINNAKVVKADIAASNGVIHVVDTVILPKS